MPSLMRNEWNWVKNMQYEPHDCIDFDTFSIQGTGETAKEEDGGVCLDDLTVTVSRILPSILPTSKLVSY